MREKLQEEKRREMRIGGERRMDTQKSPWLLPSENHPLHSHWSYWVPHSPVPNPPFSICSTFLCAAYSFTVKMEAGGFSRMLAPICQTTWCHILDNCKLNIHCWENLESHANICRNYD
jgi:hypothetical protein